MRKIAGYLTKNRSGKDQKIAQSTHENGYIKPRKTFWRNSKQLLNNLNTTHLFKPYRYSYQIVDRLPVKAGGDEVRQVADHLASNGIHLAV